MSALADARRQLAADLAAGLGVHVYPSTPPSIVPPCGIVSPSTNYARPATGCSYAVQVKVRLVTDVHESDGAYDDLDAMIEAVIPVVGRFVGADIAARDYGANQYLTAEVTIEMLVDLAPARLAAVE